MSPRDIDKREIEVYVRFHVSTVRISGMYGLRDLPVIANIVVIAREAIVLGEVNSTRKQAENIFKKSVKKTKSKVRGQQWYSNLFCCSYGILIFFGCSYGILIFFPTI